MEWDDVDGRRLYRWSPRLALSPPAGPAWPAGNVWAIDQAQEWLEAHGVPGSRWGER